MPAAIPTIAAAAKLIAAKQLSPVELTSACLDRVRALDDKLHASLEHLAPKLLQFRIARRSKPRTDLGRVTDRHFANALGDQLIGHVEVEHVIWPPEYALTTNGRLGDEKSSGHGGSVQH